MASVAADFKRSSLVVRGFEAYPYLTVSLDVALYTDVHNDVLMYSMQVQSATV